MDETFESIALDTTVNTTNVPSFSDAVIGFGGATGLVKTRSGSTSGANKHLRIDLPDTAYWMIGRTDTASAKRWTTFYLRWGATPTSNLVLVKGYSAGVTLSECVRLTTGGALAIRDTTTTRWTSTPLTAGELVRVAVLLDPANDQCRLKIYSGANVHSATASQDSGLQTLNLASATTVDQFRWGCVSGAAGISWVEYDDIRTDNTSEWLPATVNGDVVYDATGNYIANSTAIASWTVDTAGSTGTMTLTQTGGTTATVTGPTSGVFTITNPAGTDTLTFDLKADADTDETVQLTFVRGAPAKATALVRQSNGTWA